MMRTALERAARDAAEAVYLGDGALLAVVLGKYKMVLDARDRGIVPHLALDGFWESWVTVWVQRNVGAGEQVLNVGANCGYYATLLCDLVGPGGRVVAVEPMPCHLSKMMETAHLNGYMDRLTVVGGVCSDADGTVAVAYADGMTMNAQIVAADGRLKSLCDKRIDVQAFRADKLLSDMGLLPTFALIDAECHEPMVWEGMAGLLADRRQFRAVLEFAPSWYAEPAAFLDKLSADGFAVTWITLDGNEAGATRDQLLDGTERMIVVRR
jgi:FkbM family methyltransferase